jgi:hypothetical protein
MTGKLVPDTVKWNFNRSPEKESALKPLCEQVDQYFHFPVNKHFRYFAPPDDASDGYLVDEVGEYFRGLNVFASATDAYNRHLRERCLPLGNANNSANLIYIRHSACLDSTGCVVTYAHELQHSVQESRFPKLMPVNRVLRRRLIDFVPSATEIDVPIEVDANIVSKGVAEIVCGKEAVRNFAAEQIKYMNEVGAPAQVVRWEFFLNTPSSKPYDFVDSTLELVKKYEGRMDFGMKTDTPDWWKGSNSH